MESYRAGLSLEYTFRHFKQTMGEDNIFYTV